ncbi:MULTISPECIES: DUF1302 domain-containing protein [unclassified Pseudomonas]|uniref:DUF1302 domain-containing protein n=1 Tax=unclassified Pseudomonas TaxID=196821 RepID=UPI002446E403|nr:MULTISPECIES: DUF1302 domain-containing protein [unclassified Pseudomonas]MDH0893592.1 DUF1302 domain-containing protein [Pseudomonas sp. GD03875]MDH1065757.1 DUF1302 domain-containing protein [Pseudomonas sp. GD03985]
MPPHTLALAVALASALPAQAASFNIGPIEGQIDSSLSIGASWALDDADAKFVGKANGGSASTRTSDDGRLNFKKGETFSKIFKGVHDLQLRYGESGVFLRGKYWYDFELKDEHRLLYDIDDGGRDNAAQASGFELLDAFVYHNYLIGDLPGSVRAGKQVVSWGESTFIGNSINAINPADVAAFRRPGSEIKEGLIPVNMLYVTQGLTENLSVEAFYQLEWEKTVLDNCGTFFGTDTAAKGCEYGMTTFGSDRNRDPAVYGWVPRLDDREARDGGQFGVALRWLVPALNDTEFGVYALNYHSRTPESMWQVGNADFSAVTGAPGPASARYYLQYPEDIRLYGLSFATTTPDGTALSGEISHRPNMPLSLNGTDVSTAASVGGLVGALGIDGLAIFDTGWAGTETGSLVQGYKRMPFTQAQVSAVRTFDQVLGGDRLVLVGEVGYSHIGRLGSSDGSDLRFGRSSVFGNGRLPDSAAALGMTGNGLCTALLNTTNPDQCTGKGFYTRNSWGYRLRTQLEFNDAIAGVNLKPNLAFAHDVEGFGPTFTEGNKSVSLGLDADYLSTYTASLSYTNYFGGDFNTNTDRDFLAFSVGMSF